MDKLTSLAFYLLRLGQIEDCGSPHFDYLFTCEHGDLKIAIEHQDQGFTYGILTADRFLPAEFLPLTSVDMLKNLLMYGEET